MAWWHLPDDGSTTEWARLIATQYLERDGLDEHCRMLGALLSSRLVREALASGTGPLRLEIDRDPANIEIRVAGTSVEPVDGDRGIVGLLRRVTDSWGSERRDDGSTVTWCRYAYRAAARPPA